MQITNNGYDRDKRTVSATFSDKGVIHTRDVNACHDDDGAYDPDATAERLVEVSAGVAAKIAAGAITNPPAAEEVEEPKPAKKKAAPAE